MKNKIVALGFILTLAASAAAEVQTFTTGAGRKIQVRTAHFEKSIAPSPCDVARRPYGLMWASEQREWDQAHGITKKGDTQNESTETAR